MSLASAPGNVLGRLGESLTLTHYSGGTYSAATRTYSGGTSQNVTVTGAAVPFDLRSVDGTNVVAGDLQGYLSAEELDAAGVTPAEGDLLTVAGSKYRIWNLGPVRVAGTVRLYMPQLRGVK